MACRRSVALIALVTSSCYAPTDDPMTTGQSGTETESTGTASTTIDPSTTTQPSTTATSTTTQDGSESEASTASTASTDPSTSSTNDTTSSADDTTTTEASSSSSTGEPADCVGVAGHTIFLNFDGATLEMGLVENAPEDITADSFQVGTWGSYDEDDEDELFTLVQHHFSPFDVCLTRERPDLPNYDMMVITSETVADNPNHPGWAPLDCEDSQPNNTGVIALSSEANLPLATKGIIVSNQLAGVFGLESVMAQDDIMNAPIGSTLADAEFRDVCNEFAFTQMCDGSPGCGPTEHNSFALLIEVFGAAP